MPEVETVDFWASPVAGPSADRRATEGLLKLQADQLPPLAAPLLHYPEMHHQEHVVAVNGQQLTPQALGCVFLRNAQVYDCGHVLVDDHLMVQDVESSRVAERWHATARASLVGRTVQTISTPVVVVTGPGHRVYGHWLVEFIPRLMVAVMTLGEEIRDYEILLPSDTPDFAVRLCTLFFGPLNFRLYDPNVIVLRCSELCVPSFPLSAGHDFHPAVRTLFDRHRPAVRGRRKFSISRRRIEGKTAGTVKNFAQRDLFEELAKCYGYETLFPEEFTLIDQVALFGDAQVIVGEFGSALHNAVFSAPGTIVGAVGFFNTVQLRISALMDQTSVYAVPEHQDIVGGLINYGCSPRQLVGFFEVIERQLQATT
jgi:hypothetical protein